jgi:hypothetical protein
MRLKEQIRDNLSANLIGIIFVIFAYLLYLKEAYGWTVALLLALLLLLKRDALAELAFSLREGFRAKFKTDPDKVKVDIRENKEPATNYNFARFQQVEAKVLSELQKRYGGELKTKIHYVYGYPDKPEFRYTPDGSLMTEDTLYFFEIKYVLKPNLAKNIVKNTIQYLSKVYTKLSPSIGDKKFVIKLILVSGYDLSKRHFDTAGGIEIEYFKV